MGARYVGREAVDVYDVDGVEVRVDPADPDVTLEVVEARAAEQVAADPEPDEEPDEEPDKGSPKE